MNNAISVSNIGIWIGPMPCFEAIAQGTAFKTTVPAIEDGIEDELELTYIEAEQA